MTIIRFSGPNDQDLGLEPLDISADVLASLGALVEAYLDDPEPLAVSVEHEGQTIPLPSFADFHPGMIDAEQIKRMAEFFHEMDSRNTHAVLEPFCPLVADAYASLRDGLSRTAEHDGIVAITRSATNEEH